MTSILPAARHLLPLLLAAVALAGPGPASARPAQDEPVPTLQDPEGRPSREPTFEEKASELNRRVLEDPGDGKAWNDLGVLYAGAGDFEIARDAFIRAIQTAPREGDYHRNLGLAFSRLGEYEMAVAEFEAYRAFDSFGGDDFWRLIGQAQRRAGRLDDARATFAEGVTALGPELSPELMRLVLAQNEVAAEQGDEQAVRNLLAEYAPRAADWREGREEGEDGLMEADNLVHNQVTTLVEDGKLLEESGLPAEATAMFEAAYELAPARLDLLPRLVDAYLGSGQELDAEVAARLARDRYPDEAGTWIASGKVYERTGRLEEAVAAYEQALAIDESVEDLRVAIGNLLMRLGRDAEAARFLRQGVNLAGTKPEVIYNYAVSLIREGKYHAAIPSLRSVVAQLPDMYQAWLALAQCLQKTGQHARAIEPFEKAHALQPDPKLLFLAASCAQKAEQPDRAITGYLAALAADSTYVKARYNLSLAYMDAGRHSEAAASFAELMEVEGPTYRAYYSQGLAYYYLGEHVLALESFELAMELRETPNLLNAMGRVYAAMGKDKEAVAWYDLARALQEGN